MNDDFNARLAELLAAQSQTAPAQDDPLRMILERQAMPPNGDLARAMIAGEAPHSIAIDWGKDHPNWRDRDEKSGKFVASE